LGNGGSGVRALKDVQALKIVVSVSFLNFARINGFEIFVEVPSYIKQYFVRVLMDGMKSFTKEAPFKCKMLIKEPKL
jgi:hypothetical protein